MAECQEQSYYCGPAAIVNLLSCYSKITLSQSEVARLAGTSKKGTSAKGIKRALKALGHCASGFNPSEFADFHAPFILYVKEIDHWVTVIPINKHSKCNKYVVLDSNEDVVISNLIVWEDLGTNISRKDAYGIYVNIDLPLLGKNQFKKGK